MGYLLSSAVRARRRAPTTTSSREAIIASRDDALAYIENYIPEDEPLLATRAQSQRSDTQPVSGATGAALRFLAAAIGARTVVEIGTGCGNSGIWLLRGMMTDGVLTSVDIDHGHQQFARAAYRQAGFATHRSRLIQGRALEVLPRLTDEAYDMVFADAAKREYPDYVTEALRLLRPGGVLVFNHALTAHPYAEGPLSAPDADTTALREVTQLVRDDERLLPLLLPIGDGLLAAIRQH